MLTTEQLQKLKAENKISELTTEMETVPFPYLAELASSLMQEKDWYIAGLCFAVLCRRSVQLGSHCTTKMHEELKEKLRKIQGDEN